LKTFLIGELNAGRVRPGELLPPERKMAAAFGLAVGTVRQGLAALEQEGFVRREQGRGTFATEYVPRRVRQETGSYVLMAARPRDFNPTLYYGFEATCRELHHHMITCSCEDNLPVQGNLILQLLEKGIAGIVIYPLTSETTPHYQVAPLRERGIPIVFCHRGVAGFNAPLVTIPHEEMGRLAGKAFVSKGHRRVAIFCGCPIPSSDEAYRRGLRSVLRRAGADVPKEFIYITGTPFPDPEEQEKEVLERLKSMLASKDPPTAIWCTSGGMDILLHYLLQELGLSVPEDISLLGTAWGDVEGPIARRITRVAYDDREVGRRAVELLEEMGSGRRALDDTERVVIPVQIVQGQTLAQAGNPCTEPA